MSTCAITLFTIAIAIFIMLVIISLYLNRGPTWAGYIGERKIKNNLNKLPRDTYRVFNNVMLKTHNGTTQIDHIVVSIYGIFVIETKNYKGIITGSKDDEFWIQNINHTGNRKFYNPIRQNRGHVKALDNALNIKDKGWIIPIVAFSPTANVTVWSDTPIIYFNNVVNMILNHHTKLLGEDDVLTCCEKIKQVNIYSKKAAQEHIEYVGNFK